MKSYFKGRGGGRETALHAESPGITPGLSMQAWERTREPDSVGDTEPNELIIRCRRRQLRTTLPKPLKTRAVPLNKGRSGAVG